MKEYTTRLCLDCCHCDIEDGHNWCSKYDQRVPVTMPHPADRHCEYYEDIFDHADKMYKLQQIELADRYGFIRHTAKEELFPLEAPEPSKPKRKVRQVKDVWK